MEPRPSRSTESWENADPHSGELAIVYKDAGTNKGADARPQPDLAGRRRTHSTAPDLHSSRSEAVLCWCSVVAPTGFDRRYRLERAAPPTNASAC